MSTPNIRLPFALACCIACFAIGFLVGYYYAGGVIPPAVSIQK
jgi:hypothetical protein